MKLSAILFDFDGTLTQPHSIDFPTIKQHIGCPPDQPALEHIEALTDKGERRQAREILDRFEMAAAAATRPNQDAEEVVAALAEQGLPMGVLTRNSRRAVERALLNFTPATRDHMAFVMTRDDKHQPKPDPEGMLRAAANLGVPAAELLCVGDYVFDVDGARNAGAHCAFITNGDPLPSFAAPPAFVIQRLRELLPIMETYG